MGNSKGKIIPKILISKEGNLNLHLNKNIWGLIFCRLTFKELRVIASVCKQFFFQLSEDEKFWMYYVNMHQEMDTLPFEYSTWKSYFFKNIKIRIEIYFKKKSFKTLFATKDTSISSILLNIRNLLNYPIHQSMHLMIKHVVPYSAAKG